MPIKAYNLVRMVKCYYSPLCRIYHIIITELPDIGKDIVLQIAFKVINNSTGPNGLIPILLVFGAYLRIVKSNTPNSTVIKWAVALKKAIEEVKKFKAKC